MTTSASLHIVFAGGGTGGHLFPGLAVAEQLLESEPAARITFAGSGADFERSHVERAGFEYLPLPCHGLPRNPWDAVRFVTANVSGYRAAMRFLRDERVDAVVGLGGYVSVPMGRAAAARGLPLVLLEQNVIPGRATSWLAPSASLICTSFEQTRRYLRADCPVRTTGNPIRPAPPLLAFDASTPRLGALHRYPRRRLLVLGGSRGSSQLNSIVPRALYKAGTARRGWQVVHQSGENELQATATLYRKLGIDAHVAPFLNDVRGILAKTSLAICRAGGTTLAELAAAGVPAIVVPYPHAKDDHQRVNAEVFATAGAARIFETRELEGRLDNHLASLLSELLPDTLSRASMAAAMRHLARPNAAWQVAQMLCQLVRPQPALQAG